MGLKRLRISVTNNRGESTVDKGRHPPHTCDVNRRVAVVNVAWGSDGEGSCHMTRIGERNKL
jgi:hypothetical protein